MNKTILTGNVVRDIDLKFATSGTAILKNTIAVRRKTKDKNTGNYESDFIPFICFSKTAEFVAEKFIKGQGIQLEAHLQSGSYTKEDGTKVYTLDAIVENVEFLGAKGTGGNQNNSTPKNDNFNQGNFEEDIEKVDDSSDMPFN